MTTALMVCLVIAQADDAADANPNDAFDADAFLRRAEEATEERIRELRLAIRRTRDRQLKREYGQQLQQIQEPDVYVMPWVAAHSMKQGDIGCLLRDPVCLQILDGTNFRGEVRTPIRPAIFGRQAVGGGVHETGVWFSGWNTEGMRVDEVVEISGCIRVVGNRTYRTVFNGTNTVIEVQPFDLSQHFPDVEFVE